MLWTLFTSRKWFRVTNGLLKEAGWLYAGDVEFFKKGRW